MGAANAMKTQTLSSLRNFQPTLPETLRQEQFNLYEAGNALTGNINKKTSRKQIYLPHLLSNRKFFNALIVIRDWKQFRILTAPQFLESQVKPKIRQLLRLSSRMNVASATSGNPHSSVCDILTVTHKVYSFQRNRQLHGGCHSDRTGRDIKQKPVYICRQNCSWKFVVNQILSLMQ